MKKFRVCLEETVSQVFEVEAENENDAFDVAKGKYDKGEFVLEPGDLVGLNIAVENENGDFECFNTAY